MLAKALFCASILAAATALAADKDKAPEVTLKEFASKKMNCPSVQIPDKASPAGKSLVEGCGQSLTVPGNVQLKGKVSSELSCTCTKQGGSGCAQHDCK